MKTSKDVLDKIRDSLTIKGADRLRTSLGNSLEIIMKNFSRSLIFIHEFLQNAEDVNSESVEFTFKQNELIITNDGDEFIEDDINSICDIGNSPKTGLEEKIGEFGIGFKSIFLISETVEIHSGKFHFKFDAKSNKVIEYKSIWPIYPITLNCGDDCSFINQSLRPNTTFVIRLHEDLSGVKLFKSLINSKDEYINSRTLLFLTSINKITFQRVDQTNEISSVIKSCRNQVEKENYKLRTLTFNHPITGTSEKTYAMMDEAKHIVPDLIEELDILTKQYKDKSFDTIHYSFAFELSPDDDNYQLIRSNGNIQLPLYSFVPFKEFNQYLPFHLQSNFIVSPNREKIPTDSSWNQLIFEQMEDVLVDKIIPLFKNHNSWKYTWTLLFYDRRYSFNLINSVFNNIRETIKDMAILPCHPIEDKEFVNPMDAIDISYLEENNNIRSVSVDVVKKLFPDKMIIDPKVKHSFHDLVLKFGFSAASNSKTFEGRSRIIKQLISNSESIVNSDNMTRELIEEEFKSYLNSGSSSSHYSNIRNKQFIPSSTGDILNLNQLAIPKKGIDKNKFQKLCEDNSIPTLHSSLLVDEFLSLIYSIGITGSTPKDLTPTTDLIPDNHEWDQWSDQQKIELIQNLANREEQFRANQLKNLEFLVREQYQINETWAEREKWIKVDKLNQTIFPTKYGEIIESKEIEIKLTQYFTKTYIKKSDTQSVYFLSERYAHNLNYFSKRNLISFFNDMGVDTVLRSSNNTTTNFTGNFGEYLVFRILKSQFGLSNVRSLSEGADFEVTTNGSVIWIEVKSNREGEGTATARWTINETSILVPDESSKEFDNYQLYWIVDIYSTPKYYIFRQQDFLPYADFNLTAKMRTLIENTKNEAKVL